jgi:signal transduction histidine kinase
MGVLTPLWLGEELVLARWVEAQGVVYVQGLWLDWPALRAWLAESTRDLLHTGRLEPVLEGGSDRTRMLSALPVRFVPGPAEGNAGSEGSAVAMALIVAWCCAVIGVAAVGVLLFGAVSLGERRGSFVSAVTHELRTPITTMQMYTEMLSEGMVQDDAKRQRYLDTLCGEAVRLGHLIENVLAYSRLERGRRRRQSETLELAGLLDRVADRLARRAENAGMTLHTDADDSCERLSVRVDVSAVEQILLNLVDNSCKYAASADDRRVHLEAGQADGKAFLRVRDHGPGVSTVEARKLFRAFSKSARDAAHSAPGVGLGLALSRRLARAMGGDLVLGPCDDGASFTLILPSA